MKKVFIIFLFLILMLTPLLTITYFQTRETVENRFQMGGNQIELIEEFKQPETLEAGSVITKKIQVKNIGISECCVRIRAVFTSSDMEKLCDIDWNENKWVLKEDHYFYYKEILEAQEVTEPLFTEIVIKEDVSNIQIQPFDVLVYAESFHAEAGDDYETIWEQFQRNKPKGDF